MTRGARIRLRIGNLRVTGATRAEAAALASALRETLAARLAADPGALAGQGADQLRLTLPSVPRQGPAALGQAAGQRIAGALAKPKGGK
jgi:hypothetical protein